MIPKFRVYDKTLKLMLTVTALFPEENYVEAFIDKNVQVETLIEIDLDENAVLMQSTGLFDSNGVEICDGDFIKWYYSEAESISLSGIISVQYTHGGFYVNNENIPWNIVEFLEGLNWYEVVGNIHENPELLEEE